MNQGSGNPRTQGSPQSFHLFHKMLTCTPFPPPPNLCCFWKRGLACFLIEASSLSLLSPHYRQCKDTLVACLHRWGER